MTEHLELLGIVGGLLAFYLLVPPLLIYVGQRFRREMQILPFDPKTVPGSRKMVKFFDRSIEEMAEIGFECLGEYALPDMMPNAKAVAQMYRNVTTRESAMVNSIWGIANGTVIEHQQYAEFICRFSHDEICLIQTNNATRLGAFPDDRHELTFRLPQMKSIAELYHCHERLMERHAPKTQRVLRVDDEYHGDAEDYLRQVVLVETFDHQISTGYLQLAEVGWRPTIYGAMLMTWKELWPFKPLREAAMQRQGLRLAASLEQEFGPLPD